MKTTKTVEVTLCDRCGDEITDGSWHTRECASCKRELCANCEVRYNVSIEQWTPGVYDQWDGRKQRHYTGKRIETDFEAVYCETCGTDIAKALLAAGLVKKISKPKDNVVIARSA